MFIQFFTSSVGRDIAVLAFRGEPYHHAERCLID